MFVFLFQGPPHQIKWRAMSSHTLQNIMNFQKNQQAIIKDLVESWSYRYGKDKIKHMITDIPADYKKSDCENTRTMPERS